MKSLALATGIAVLAGSTAMAADYNFTVTNMMEEGRVIAPLIVVDAAQADATMFDGGKLSDAYVTTILEGDPRPMNGTMPEAVAGPVLGTSGPPEVLIDGGETASADMFILANTLRFYAKAGYDATDGDTVISGVWDIAMGGGTLMLHRYDIGHSEGTGEITLVEENVVKVVITAN